MALLGLSFLSPPRTVLVSRLGRVILDDMFDLAECQDKMVRIGRIVGPVREFFVFCHAGPSIRLPESTRAKIVFKNGDALPFPQCLDESRLVLFTVLLLGSSSIASAGTVTIRMPF